MPKRSAGLLPYRLARDGTLEVFLVHPGGPFWNARDERSWSVAKGEYAEGEEASAAAEREFVEEVGVSAPPGPRRDLGEVRQSSGKLVTAWAIEAEHFTVTEVRSNEFELEWPPRSGVSARFPEVDRAEWMSATVARHRLVAAEVVFIDRLIELLGTRGAPPLEGG